MPRFAQNKNCSTNSPPPLFTLLFTRPSQHAPHWAIWQKTHSSLMSQFLEDKTAALLKPDKPKPIRGEDGDDDEDADEAADSITPLSTSVTLAQENEMRKKMQFILDGTAHSLFKRISDTSEKCRELSLQIIRVLILNVLDLTKHGETGRGAKSMCLLCDTTATIRIPRVDTFYLSLRSSQFRTFFPLFYPDTLPPTLTRSSTSSSTILRLTRVTRGVWQASARTRAIWCTG